VLSAAVTSGLITAPVAWPDYFLTGLAEGEEVAFPSTDADMSGFELEEATPESFAADIEALVAASQQVSVREEEPDPFPHGLPYGLPDPEWT
jgi:hypothetical protein